MRNFDTKVQLIKYKVLKEVARLAWQDKLFDHMLDIPSYVNPTRKPITGCCIYKEKAVINERVQLAMGGNLYDENIIEVIQSACDECPMGGYEVSQSCRGCLAHRCQSVCPKNAISFDHQHRAVIDKSKCVGCGLCAQVCPYHAIRDEKRPCMTACKVDAISFDENNIATIDEQKCIRCGACVFQCPFGAIMDKSYVLNVIDMLKKSEHKKAYKVYAVIAPAIAGQFFNCEVEQVVTALKNLGFHAVVEAALGADAVAELELHEWVEKGFLTSSCCPAFVTYINKYFPSLTEHISNNLSPMAYMGSYIKKHEPEAKVVFIGPCIAKKQERELDSVKAYIDAVITFEELEALIDSKDIDVSCLEQTPLNNASYFGRIFARSGGLTEALAHAIEEHNIQGVVLEPTVCDGIEACKKALFKKMKGLPAGNFIEGMICSGGCIGGPGSLNHGPKNKMMVDQYGKKALEKASKDAKSQLL